MFYTGQKTNSQKNVWSFEFDCADPLVNFTDGVYATDIVVKKNSVVTAAYIKYINAVNVHAGTVVEVIAASEAVIDNVWPVAVPLNFTQGEYYQPTPPVRMPTELNQNGEYVLVSLTGMTAHPPTSCRFFVVLEITDNDIN